jgi:hypothetical protein
MGGLGKPPSASRTNSPVIPARGGGKSPVPAKAGPPPLTDGQDTSTGWQIPPRRRLVNPGSVVKLPDSLSSGGKTRAPPTHCIGIIITSCASTLAAPTDCAWPVCVDTAPPERPQECLRIFNRNEYAKPSQKFSSGAPKRNLRIPWPIFPLLVPLGTSRYVTTYVLKQFLPSRPSTFPDRLCGGRSPFSRRCRSSTGAPRRDCGSRRLGESGSLSSQQRTSPGRQNAVSLRTCRA